MVLFFVAKRNLFDVVPLPYHTDDTSPDRLAVVRYRSHF